MALLSLLALAMSAATQQQRQPASVERWGLLELSFTGPAESGSRAATSDAATVPNAFLVELSATFTAQQGSAKGVRAAGFFDGGTVYKIRFSPPSEGRWCWRTSSSEPSLHGQRGCFEATAPSAANHGPVESHGYSLRYADGTPHYSSGTTCYQWASKGAAMQNQTLATLNRTKAFNKIRMTLFPKW